MILMFTFCLYYVLHKRHRQVVTAALTTDDPFDSMVPTGETDLAVATDFLQTKFIGFSDFRFVICILLLILLVLLSIPIGGLTGFHIYLVARGRTTNEQVTGKFHQQGDVFTKGVFRNFIYLLCQPLYPQLKAPVPKRYDVELFETMAFGHFRLPNGKKKSSKKVPTKVVYETTKEDEPHRPKRKKKKAAHEERRSEPNIHVNPMSERSKSAGAAGSKRRTKPSHKPIKIPEQQVRRTR